jgi:hypothetical protein
MAAIAQVKYSGRLKIADDLELTVHVLDNGQQVIPEGDLMRFMEWLTGNKTIDIADLYRRMNEGVF